MRKLTQINIGQPALSSNVIGKGLKHESANKQVCGDAPFIDDYPTPKGCLHAAVIVSSIAKGTITSLDLSAVAASAGVVKVVDHTAIPGEKDIGPIFKGDPLLVFDNVIKHHGQPIAFVLAKTERQAWQAAQKAVIEYNEDKASTEFASSVHLPPLLPVHTMAEQAPSQSLSESNSSETLTLDGDIHVGGQEHFYLETQASLAEVAEDGGIFLRCSTQNPTEIQKLVAEVLAIDFNRVTIDMRRMGGGFGGKESQASHWACFAALGAILTGKAVKIRLPRRIDMTATGKRHPFYNQYQLRTDKEGIIQKADIQIHGLCGHSPDLSDAIVDRAMFHADNAYYLGESHIEGHRLKTDTVSHTAFRGFGGPQGVVLIEKAMEQLAIETGQDALDLRLKNLYRPGKTTTPYGMEVDQHDTLKQVIEDLAQSCDYRARRQAIREHNQKQPIVKRGLALTPVKFGISFTAQHLNQAGALLHVYTDGSVQVSHGGTEMGQGLHTKIQQIVAHALGIDFDKVLVTSTRTDKVPNTSPTAASSGTDLNGMAAYNAAMIIKERVIEFAKAHYQSEQVRIEDGLVHCDEQALPWAEVVQKAYLARVSLSTTGFYKTPKIHYDRKTGKGRPFFYFAIGACCSEVSIDTLTGEMKVERVDILHDVGHSLNPAIDIGQIEGGYIQGLGWLTTEELVWHPESGRLLSDSPMNYKIPSIHDYPNEMNIALFDKANPEHSIYRSKAIGEPPFMHAISTWCAIYDAVAAVSSHQQAPQLHAPATGEAILMACESLRQQPQEVKRHADATLK